jgi:hypothetical protein
VEGRQGGGRQADRMAGSAGTTGSNHRVPVFILFFTFPIKYILFI